DAEVHIGERFLQRRESACRLHDVEPALRPPFGRIARDLFPRSDDRQLVKTEILHRASRRADVAGFVRLDQDYANVHSCCGTKPPVCAWSKSAHVRMYSTTSSR